MLRVYVYVDDVCQYKTEIFSKIFNPILDLDITLELLQSHYELRLDFYDASMLSEDQINEI